MISLDTMSGMATRAFVIEELLETIYEVAREAEDPSNSSDLSHLSYRIRHLVHGASALAGTLAHDLSNLMGDATLHTDNPEGSDSKTRCLPEYQTGGALSWDEKDAPASDSAAESRPVVSLGLGSYAFGILKNYGIKTVDALLLHTELDLIKLPGIGRQTISKIKTRLAEHGLSLKEPFALRRTEA